MATATLTVSASAPAGYKYVEIVTPDLSNTLGIAYSLSPTLATSDLIVFNKWYQADGVTTSWSVTISTNGVPQFSHISGTQSLTFNYFIWDESTSAYGTTAAYSIAYTEIQVQPRVNNIWQWLQAAEPTPGGVTDKIQKYLTSLGYTGSTNESLYRWLGARGYEGSLADRIYQFEYFNTFRYIDISAKLVLEKFGTDAHVWIPGIGYFNGLDAGNYIDSAGTQAGLVDNPVGRANDAVGAITATQGTTANKPILRRGAVNLLTYSEQFDNAAWTKDQSSLDANTAIAPNSTQTADYIKEDGTTNVHQVRGNFTVISGATYNFSVYIKAGNRTWASFSFSNPTASVFFNLTNGAIGTTTGSVSGNVISVGNGWYRCSATVTATATTLTARIQAATSDNTNFYLGDGTSGIYVWGAQLELGSTASEYIPTTTAAASSSSGDYYWQFDGSNDSLALSSVPFQMADDHCVVAGANAVAGAAATIFSIGNTASNNDVIAMDYTSNFFRVWWRDTALTVESLASPTTRNQQILVGSMRKTGNTKIGRINGSQYGTGSIVMGSTTLNTAAIGVFSRTTLSAYMTGSVYPVIAIKGTISDADLLVLERWVGSLSGVSVP